MLPFANKVFRAADGVCELEGRGGFDYSDGRKAESALTDALTASTDISSASPELESYVTDWPTEYHLSRKRADLLRGFIFDPSARVLEVGCGCGAITRFLGETFASVTSVEGSRERASIARLRTRDQENVEIVCANLSELEFTDRFDVVFCIGVLEYAQIYGHETEPHDAMLRRLRSLLNPDGALVLAIENQFGLKYFSSSSEDHTHAMFDGIEGYPRNAVTPRTFGYQELRQRLQVSFDHVEMYFPFPDYKVPQCVVSEEMTHRASVAELAGGYAARDYSGYRKPLFDELLALSELERNGMLPAFANSYLAVAYASEAPATPRFDGLGVAYSSHRTTRWQTVTRFRENGDDNLSVHKELCSGGPFDESGRFRLRGGSFEWLKGETLQLHVRRRCFRRSAGLAELLEPTRVWFDALVAESFVKEGRRCVDGKRLDGVWKNTIVLDDVCHFIDPEWESVDDLPLDLLVIRALYIFLRSLQTNWSLPYSLRHRSLGVLIRRGASLYGVEIGVADLREFANLEAEFQSLVAGVPLRSTRRLVATRLISPAGPTVRTRLRYVRSAARRFAKKVKAGLRSFRPVQQPECS